MSVVLTPDPASFDADDTLPIRQQPRTSTRAASAANSRIEYPLTFPLLVWIVHSVVVIGAAYLAFRHGTMNSGSPPYGRDAPPLSGWQGQIVEPLRLWDGLWYRLIALEGYAYDDAVAAFWPALPISMRWFSRLTGLPEETSGFLIANVAFAVALMILYRLLTLDVGQVIARRSLWILALFPTALFFSAVYTESVFLMFAAGSLYAARVQKWWIAGVLGLLAALTRSYGVFLGLPLLVLFIQHYGLYLRAFFPRILAVGLPALGPLLFGWHLEEKQGSWRQFIDVQNQWNRTFAWPWETMKCAVRGCELTVTQYGQTSTFQVSGADWSWLRMLNEHPGWSTIKNPVFRLTVADSDTLELTMTILFIGLAVVGLKFLPLYQSAYLIPGLVIPLFSPSTVHPLMSMPRFGLTLFPLFVVIALHLRSRALRLPILALSTVILILLTAQFANWYWVS